MSGASGGLAPHVLHVLPDDGARSVIEAFGTKLRHTLLTAGGDLPEGMRHSAYLKPARNFPALGGLPTPGRMQKLARALTQFDLVLTYGYDALDVAMAHTLFKDAMDLPALIHHERVPDIGSGLKRTWYRRIALGKSAGLVVPSEALEETALVDWQQPMGRVKRIPPGIDTRIFAKSPKKDGYRLIKRDGELWVGAWPLSRDENALLDLIAAFKDMQPEWQLVVLGDDLRSPAIEEAIDRFEINDRVYFPGTPRDPAKVIGLFDLFVEPAELREFPIHVVEAMAASVPVVALRAGECGEAVAEENQEWLVDIASPETLGANLRGLAGDRKARAAVGEANRARAVKQYDRSKTMDTYRRLYSSAMRTEF